MRYSILIFFFILLSNLSSCKTTQKVNEEKTLLKIDSLKNTSNKLYLLKNKKLDIVSLNGSLSYEKKDNEKTNVIQFVYERDMDQAAYDGGYKEEVIYEIPNDISEQNYSDAELQNTKMLFGRYCYSRGKTGLY
jgi:hypothetical protein